MPVQRPGARTAHIPGPLKPATEFHMIAVDDIGWFVAKVFANPYTYIGEIIEIAGDRRDVAAMK
jgi:hypothetical protein